MGLMSKFFGPSEFQNEFQKANSLNWILVINNIRDLEYSFGKSVAKQNFTDSSLEFDFSAGVFCVNGSLVDDVFNNRSEFQIVKSQLSDGDLVFYLSLIGDNNIVMTCKVRRDHLFFEGTRSNWYVKLLSERMVSYGH